MKPEIVETFSLLHDGYLESIKGEKSKLRFNISIDFLMGFINETFTSLFIDIYGVSDIEFQDWSDNRTIYTNFEAILKIASEIWLTKSDLTTDGRIALHGHGGNSEDESSCGGSLLFNCEKYQIVTEDGTILSLDQLRILNKTYWDKFHQIENSTDDK